MFCLNLYAYGDLTYERKYVTYTFPSAAIAVGWIVAFGTFAITPIYAIVALIMTPGHTFREVKKKNLLCGQAAVLHTFRIRTLISATLQKTY